MSGRRPWAKDMAQLDYTIDSDDEWDNEPDDAESLASNDDDDEEEIDPADIERADGLEEVLGFECLLV